MRKKIISLIIPIYNTQDYLKECIDSIINQSFRDIELILVNDGSTDNCYKICKEYAEKDNRIKVINKENGGLSDARNCGIDAAEGDYILFIDSDDFIAENSLNKIVNTIQEQPDVDVIFLEAVKYFNYNKKTIKQDVMDFLTTLPKFPASAWAKLIKRDLILDNKLYFIKGITNEDLDWTVRLLLAANSFNYCDADYYYYRQQRPGSITNEFSLKKFKCLFDNIKYVVKIAKEENSCLFRDNIYNFMAYEYSILLYGYSKLNKESKKKFKEDIKSYSWLMDYREENKNKIIRKLYKFLGLDITSQLLYLYLKIR